MKITILTKKLKKNFLKMATEDPDEFVLVDVKMIYYKVMHSKEVVWMGIYTNDDKIYHLNITGDNLKVRYSDETP